MADHHKTSGYAAGATIVVGMLFLAGITIYGALNEHPVTSQQRQIDMLEMQINEIEAELEK